MKKAFKYRIYPNMRQTALLNKTLDECRWLYNHFLEQRKNSWEQDKKSLSCFDQSNTLKHLKKDRESLKFTHSQLLQNVAVRIDLAFKAFFRRAKEKKKEPGYPKFKGKHFYNSFTYPQIGFEILADENVIKLSKIGKIKIRYDRPTEGKLKTCTVKKSKTGKWFVTLVCEVEPNILLKTTKSIGIDVGLLTFATLSDGSKIKNPRFFRQEEKNLANANRKLSKHKMRTPEWIKAKRIVARINERITNRRHDFIHQIARKLINEYDIIVVEDLKINEMQEGNFRCINKSIGDVAWRMFIDILSQKAVETGKQVVKVNPAYTSQTCSKCGYREKKSLSERTHKCKCCGFELDRDHNAAINILTLGMQSLASA